MATTRIQGYFLAFTNLLLVNIADPCFAFFFFFFSYEQLISITFINYRKQIHILWYCAQKIFLQVKVTWVETAISKRVKQNF